MSRFRFLFVALALLMFGAMPLMAQQPRVSPPDITSAVIGGNRVTLCYSRPYTKDPKTGTPRKIWGGLVPYGKVWRTGANEATMLVLQQPIEMDGKTIPAGAYTLFTLPQEDGSATLIINKQLGQWGLQYDEKQDFARVPLTKAPAPKTMDQFTMAVERNPAGGGLIKMMWEDTQYSVPFTTVKK